MGLNERNSNMRKVNLYGGFSLFSVGGRSSGNSGISPLNAADASFSFFFQFGEDCR